MPAVLTMQLHRRSRATFAIDLGRLLTYTYDASNAPQLQGQGSVCVNPFAHQRATGHTFSRPRAAIAVSIECGGEMPTKVVGAPAPALAAIGATLNRANEPVVIRTKKDRLRRALAQGEVHLGRHRFQRASRCSGRDAISSRQPAAFDDFITFNTRYPVTVLVDQSSSRLGDNQPRGGSDEECAKDVVFDLRLESHMTLCQIHKPTCGPPVEEPLADPRPT
jgi:hypothetical protein